ncbi:MAG TPA: rhomboid family intramembrane serine protease [Bacteroidia bacterium]|nr:rhomboid family intramembrane serine protease [Bacteroidia bacterium]
MRNKTTKLYASFFYPGIFILLLWTIKLFEETFNVNLAWYGLYPRTVHGLLGILTAPLLHADFGHLMSNTIPLFILGSIIVFFYRSIAFPVFFWVYFMTGIWVWAAGRNSYHIGASGIIYGFISFLFFSGVFRKDTRLSALSLFVVFVYGSTVWGMLPLITGISWESHLLGAVAGVITAYNFRKEGPQPRKYDFGDEEENAKIDVSGEQFFDHPEIDAPHIQPIYTYISIPTENPTKE